MKKTIIRHIVFIIVVTIILGLLLTGLFFLIKNNLPRPSYPAPFDEPTPIITTGFNYREN